MKHQGFFFSPPPAAVRSNRGVGAALTFVSSDAFLTAAAPPAVTRGTDRTCGQETLSDWFPNVMTSHRQVRSHLQRYSRRACSSAAPPAGRSRPCSARSGGHRCSPGSSSSADPRRPAGSTGPCRYIHTGCLLQDERQEL